MVKSMTGYGRNQALVSGYDITVEIKSVNHRYFECSARVPRAYGYLEDKLKTFVHQKVSRGKVEVYVGITAVETTDTTVEINRPLAKSYLNELGLLSEELGIKNNLKISHIARFNDIYTLRRHSDDDDVIWAMVEQVAANALDSFNAMREKEGEKLREDILLRIDLIENYVEKIKENSPQIVSAWRDRLYAKISEVLEEKQIDQQRLLTEAAIYAEKIAVDEETVRLGSHISQFRDILGEKEALGRKLDFLVQEINRETNTIGSKSQDSEATKIVVEMKSETEKIREQIQNIE